MNQPGREPDLSTSSINLTELAPLVAADLSAEESDAIRALPAGSALLLADGGPEKAARFLLDQDVVTVGRHPDADIFLDDVTVSRRHAEFRAEAGGHRLVDMNSLNGTFVNHDRVDDVLLRSGMHVQIGKYRLTYFTSTQRG
ncbi:FHA domain-containing protein [Micrococcus endophyticus]|uniref:PSer/pThr/pTyr-binding forkhead associated (FHA) protein n=1 Tax=Micrococcus endophyticus TaxID=455343 RepID=A0A4Y8ZEL0_9MICC|nr:FHA domain-containing protein [Micrococcus endophyticus]MBB5847913.1 pSer/pThr/pTyr-binding forkhead associated (FHA) protein [Micrococcus endophyticus]TFI48801.1 FHA domain-containing protein [Micrococcus endophyticus]